MSHIQNVPRPKAAKAAKTTKTTKASRGFTFVAADELGKLRSTDRKLIRSHCMVGKNTKKTAHKGERDGILAEYGIPRKPPLFTFFTSSLISSKPLSGSHSRLFEIMSKDMRAAESKSAVDMSYFRPQSCPSDMSLINFADEVNNHSRELLFRCLSSPTSSRAITNGKSRLHVRKGNGLSS